MIVYIKHTVSDIYLTMFLVNVVFEGRLLVDTSSAKVFSVVKNLFFVNVYVYKTRCFVNDYVYSSEVSDKCVTFFSFFDRDMSWLMLF